jgi:hypothetical protein
MSLPARCLTKKQASIDAFLALMESPGRRDLVFRNVRGHGQHRCETLERKQHPRRRRREFTSRPNLLGCTFI